MNHCVDGIAASVSESEPNSLMNGPGLGKASSLGTHLIRVLHAVYQNFF